MVQDMYYNLSHGVRASISEGTQIYGAIISNNKIYVCIYMYIYFYEALMKCYHATIHVEWHGNSLSNSIILMLLGRLLFWPFSPKKYIKK